MSVLIQPAFLYMQLQYMQLQFALEKGRGPNRSGRDLERDSLEAQRCAQVDVAISSRGIDNAERRAECVQCGGWGTRWVASDGVKGPPRVIQNVIETGEKLEGSLLHNLK